MKVGTLAYPTYQGLGILAKDFYDNGIVNHVMAVHHWKYENQPWYDGPSTSLRAFSVDACKAFIKEMDVMFFFETPFATNLIPFCRRERVKTILMPMYECTPLGPWINEVDLILNPSLLDQKMYPQGICVPVPIPRWVQWKKRDKALTFVHNAGHGGLEGRNGTAELLQALQYIESDAQIIIRSQEPIRLSTPSLARASLQIGTIPREELYELGDVFLFPEKFNGLSLPLQEAKASGMAVMATNRFPTNEWTNRELLIPSGATCKTTVCNRRIDAAVILPERIAETIDLWYGKNIEHFSIEGKGFGTFQSWDELREVYMSQILSLFFGGKR